jgi:hypothetical protein
VVTHKGIILLRYARLYFGRLTLYFTKSEKIQGRRDSRLLSILLMRNVMRTQLGRQLTPKVNGEFVQIK